MYFSLQKLLSFLVFVSPGLLFPLQQISIKLSHTSDDNPEYGYSGPGTYYISSVKDHRGLGLRKGNHPWEATVVVKPRGDWDSWYISEAGNGYLTIAHNYTGKLLDALESDAPVGASCTSPGDSGAKWHVVDLGDEYILNSRVFRLENGKFKDESLTVIHGREVYNIPTGYDSLGYNEWEAVRAY